MMFVLLFLRRILVFVVILFVFVYLINYWLHSKRFIFSEDSFANIASKYEAYNADRKHSSPTALYENVYRDLLSKYPGHILDKSHHQWVFLNVGGLMGSMCVLHASVTEYVLFFGSALDTSGHSGRYWANMTYAVLSGEYHLWREGELTADIYKPGSSAKQVWGEVASVHFKAGTWTVIYGRGFIPSTLGFVLADTIFSTQDFLTLFYILRIYFTAMFGEISYYITNPGNFLSS